MRLPSGMHNRRSHVEGRQDGHASSWGTEMAGHGLHLPASMPLRAARCHLLKIALVSDVLPCFQTMCLGHLIKIITRKRCCSLAKTSGKEETEEDTHGFFI